MLYLNGKFVNTKNTDSDYEFSKEVAEYHKAIKEARAYYGDFLVVRTRQQPKPDELTGFPIYPSTRGLLLRTTMVEDDSVQEWLYSPVVIKAGVNGDLDLSKWEPNLLIQKGAHPIDMKRNPDLAFYVLKTHYVGTTDVEGKKFHLEDTKDASIRNVESRRKESRIAYLIYNGIDINNLKTIAKAWGISSVDAKIPEVIMTELHDKVKQGEAMKTSNPGSGHRGYDEFIESSQIKYHDKVAALCKDAEEAGKLVFDVHERKWVIDYQDGGIPYVIKELAGDEFGDPMASLITFLLQEKDYLDKIQRVMDRPLERPDGYEVPEGEKPDPSDITKDLTMDQIQSTTNVMTLRKMVRTYCPDVEVPNTMKAEEAKQILMSRLVAAGG